MHARKHETVAKGKKMSLVFVFFSEQIGRVEFASDVGEGDIAIGDGFTDGVFTNIIMAEVFGGGSFRPIDAALVIIKDWSR